MAPQAHDILTVGEYVAPAIETVMTEESLAREVKYAGDGTFIIEDPN